MHVAMLNQKADTCRSARAPKAMVWLCLQCLQDVETIKIAQERLSQGSNRVLWAKVLSAE
jgi:hypothetical protein